VLHGISGYTNALHRYIVHTLPILFIFGVGCDQYVLWYTSEHCDRVREVQNSIGMCSYCAKTGLN